jgi:hypothetical protein
VVRQIWHRIGADAENYVGEENDDRQAGDAPTEKL